MAGLGQFGSVHGRVGRFMASLGQLRSVWVGSSSIWISLDRFMVGLGRFMASMGQFRSVWVGSWSAWVSLGWFMVGLGRFMVSLVSLGRLMVDLCHFGSVHGRVGTVHGQFSSV